jgi:hypothetical protein
MTQNKQSQILFLFGGTITILGAFAQLFDIVYAPYIFSVGAAIVIYWQFMQALRSKDVSKRMQRLVRMGFLSSLMLALAAYLMFVHSNSWVVAVLIYALTTIFYSFRGEK